MTRPRSLIALVAALVLLGACSGDDGGDDVATLDPSSTSTTADDSADDGDEPGGNSDSQSRDEALVAYMQCLRDNGVEDAPDPEVNEDGELRLPLHDEYADDPDYPDAETACAHFLEDVIGPERTPEQILEAEDHALEFAKCMRDNGIDMPDPPPGAGGFNVLQDREGRAIDSESPEYEAASDTCTHEVFGGGAG